ncbi:hypothetical protein C0J52_27186 [Blattella germanica]|nr:hypothetical protein C0J52_27186 [Blattella germanica]
MISLLRKVPGVMLGVIIFKFRTCEHSQNTNHSAARSRILIIETAEKQQGIVVPVSELYSERGATDLIPRPLNTQGAYDPEGYGGRMLNTQIINKTVTNEKYRIALTFSYPSIHPITDALSLIKDFLVKTEDFCVSYYPQYSTKMNLEFTNAKKYKVCTHFSIFTVDYNLWVLGWKINIQEE